MQHLKDRKLSDCDRQGIHIYKKDIVKKLITIELQELNDRLHKESVRFFREFIKTPTDQLL